NYIELRRELETDFEFKTQTDTEVLLAAFEAWGTGALDRLNGMFALALYDHIENSVLIARDRFGIKPLYYHFNGETLTFASDIPPLLSQVARIEPDDQSIYDFLVFNRTNHTENTFFKGIKRLLHGHYLRYMNQRLETVRWYDLAAKAETPFRNGEEFISLFDDAIQLQLRSDVPVGACLSGGLDSSAIVSMIARGQEAKSLQTFSAVYGTGETGDESGFIDLFRGRVGAMHFARPTSETLLADLPGFVDAVVEPLPGTSEYAEFKVMELAKKHVTVLLNGQGADELLAGYLYFAGYYYKELAKSGRVPTLVTEMAADYRRHRSLEGIMAFVFFSLPSYLKERLRRSGLGVLNSDFAAGHSASSEITRKLFDSPNLHQSFLDHFEYKFEHHLLWADKTGMAFSLETRFPFLDHRLVEKLLALPSEQIIKNGENKYFLREAMAGILPEAIRGRHDKVGYETPENKWFRTEPFAKLFRETFNSKVFRDRPYLNADKVNSKLEAHLSGSQSLGNELWKWLHLELWFRRFIERGASWRAE
ncbi:MAG TPA: asparagine synthase (glutamine-hydrolyzing), partial [Bdellovibrionales bacterium]|nr:asparagine synthase (glutamine-hydrolyzing) [Bdellovibrionales bacterium]